MRIRPLLNINMREPQRSLKGYDPFFVYLDTTDHPYLSDGPETAAQSLHFADQWAFTNQTILIDCPSTVALVTQKKKYIKQKHLPGQASRKSLLLGISFCRTILISLRNNFRRLVRAPLDRILLTMSIFSNSSLSWYSGGRCALFSGRRSSSTNTQYRILFYYYKT